MRLFGFELVRRAAADAARPVSAPGGGRGWIAIREAFAGAWQRDIKVDLNGVLANPTIFACITLIAADISKLRVKLMQRDAVGIWSETDVPAFSPVLRKPNGVLNRIQFYAGWVISKLTHGNTYVLKARSDRTTVAALYLLDPNLVTPLVAPNGEVYYRLQPDDLAGIGPEGVVVPASEIIHDRMNCLFHPLVGLSPIFAAGLAATHGLDLMKESVRLSRNGSRPGGLLLAPDNIDQADADRLKAYWEKNYTGENAGKIAVLGSGLKFENLSVNAKDNELAEKLKWSDEKICSCFHVPAYMVGVGGPPTYNNIEALSQQYYSQCLQTHIESIEICLDEGLALPTQYGTELDLDGLLRMDTATQYKALADAVKGGIMTPNEARRKIDMPKLTGGDTVYMQEQNYSLEALAKRDAREDPFASSKSSGGAANAEPAALPPPDETAGKDFEALLARIEEKTFDLAAA